MTGDVTEKPADAVEVVKAFVRAINRHDVERLASLMTEDHVFLDGVGGEVHGREAMREAWERYFELFPDYELEIEDALRRDEVVGLFGVARGTYAGDGESRPENRWEVPAAWRAATRGRRVARWSVFADNEPVRRLVEGGSLGEEATA